MVVRRSRSKTKRRKIRTCKKKSRRTGRKHNRTRRRRKKIQRGGLLSWNRIGQSSKELFYNLDDDKYEYVEDNLLQDYLNSIIEYGYLFGTKKGASVPDTVPNLEPLVIPASAVALSTLPAPTVLLSAAGMVAAPFVINKARNSFLHQQCLFVSRSSSAGQNNRYFTDIDLLTPLSDRSDVTIVTGVCYTSDLSQRLLTLANLSHTILHTTVREAVRLPQGMHSLRRINTRHSDIASDDGVSPSSLHTISDLKDMTNTLSKKKYRKYMGEYGLNDSLNCRRFATDLFSLAGFTN